MIKREFVKLKGCKRVWHAITNDSRSPLCRWDFNISEYNGRVIAVMVKEEHKPPRPFCRICARSLRPGLTNRYRWVEEIRLYPNHGH